MKIPVVKELVEKHSLADLEAAEAAIAEGETPAIEVPGEDEGEQLTHAFAALFIRRMMEQQKMGGGVFFGAFPESYNLVVNANHSKVGMLLETSDTEEQQTKVKQLTDLALLSQGMLKGEELSNFIERSIAFI